MLIKIKAGKYCEVEKGTNGVLFLRFRSLQKGNTACNSLTGSFTNCAECRNAK